jgi:hypothetical protein
MIGETQFTVKDFRKRIQAMNDMRLVRYGKAAAYMADPKYSANGRACLPNSTDGMSGRMATKTPEERTINLV